MRTLWLVFLLSACSAAESESEPEAIERPQTFSITPADFWRDKPQDICRNRDASFLTNLMDRARSALPYPPEMVSFHDFNVTDQDDALLRIKVEGHGLLTIAGSFDRRDCEIGDQTIHKGPNMLGKEIGSIRR